jgi:hypothetical protein
VNCYLPTSCCGQADLHTPDLWLTAYPLYAFSTWEDWVTLYTYQSHHCIVHSWVHRKLGINLRFQSLPIVKVSRTSYGGSIYNPVRWFYFDNEHFQILGGDLMYHTYIMLENYFECIRYFKFRIMYNMLSSKNYWFA